MRSFLNLILSLLTLTLFGCPVDLSPGVLQPDDDDATSDDDDSTVADDDDATPTDDDDSTVADDDDDATPVDNDVDNDGIPAPPDRLWVGPYDLCWSETDLDHLEAAYLEGNGLGYTQPPLTDWAQQVNEVVCQGSWCCPDYDLIPEGTLRLSVSDGTPESLNNGNLWRTTGTYCDSWPDPACWDNRPYGGQGWANCVDHWYDANGDHRFASSSGCADTY